MKVAERRSIYILMDPWNMSVMVWWICSDV